MKVVKLDEWRDDLLNRFADYAPEIFEYYYLVFRSSEPAEVDELVFIAKGLSSKATADEVVLFFKTLRARRHRGGVMSRVVTSKDIRVVWVEVFVSRQDF